MTNATTREIKQAIRDKYTFPGCYPMFLLTDDGAALCTSCGRTMWRAICDSVRRKMADGWRVVAVDVNWEDSELVCDHCGNMIESAYGDD